MQQVPATLDGPALEAAAAGLAADFGAVAGEDNAQLFRGFLADVAAALPGGRDSSVVADAAAAAAPHGTGNCSASGAEVSVLLHPIASKDGRRKVYDFFRDNAGRLPPLTAEAATVTQAESAAGATSARTSQPASSTSGGSIQIMYRPAGRLAGSKRPRDGDCAGNWQQGGGGGDRNKWKKDSRGGGGGVWEGGSCPYVRFVLAKENMDTQSALGVLGRLLHVKPSAFGFAGTKDKRGVTCQYVTAYRVSARRLCGLRLYGMALGDYSYCQEELVLGRLAGNRFRLLLRGCEASEEEVRVEEKRER